MPTPSRGNSGRVHIPTDTFADPVATKHRCEMCGTVLPGKRNPNSAKLCGLCKAVVIPIPLPHHKGAWIERGLCQQVDPDLFTSDRPTDQRRAAAICNGTFEGAEPCPVRYQCLQWALDTNQPVGVWGGVGHLLRAVMVAKRKERRARRAGSAA